MPYSEMLIRPMREELTRHGIEEWTTAEQAREGLESSEGTLLVVINSVCGCAARNARPAVAMALQHPARPDRTATVFAGQDAEATQVVRDHLHGYPPSSPSIALFRDGQAVLLVERHQIEGRSAEDIARDLTDAFEEHRGAAA